MLTHVLYHLCFIEDYFDTTSRKGTTSNIFHMLFRVVLLNSLVNEDL